MMVTGILFLLFWYSLTVHSHSWTERVDGLSANGSLLGPSGFTRGYVDGDEKDLEMTYLLPPNGRRFANGTAVSEILPTDLMCSTSQETYNQTQGFPIYAASPGAQLVLRHQENGHVTLVNPPIGKASPGQVFVYGTASPASDDKLLSIHNVWTADGSGGDQHGVLLGVHNFDDGRCYQINNTPISRERQLLYPHPPDPVEGADLWCRVPVTLPQNLTPGSIYTLYWVWDWPTSATNSTQAKPEIYTSCIDIGII